MLRIRTLGGLSIEGPASPVTAEPRCLALLARLAAARDDGIRREDALTLLWPDQPPPNALDDVLGAIRTGIHPRAISADTARLRLSSDVIVSDFSDFQRAVDQGNLELAEELYQGPFLNGFRLPDAPAFERWVMHQRERLDHHFGEMVVYDETARDTPDAQPPAAAAPPHRRRVAATCEQGAVIAAQYVIERELGHGGSATVYLAHDLKHDRDVALKFVRARVADAMTVDRFQQEIAVLARLQHPHIMPLYDSGESGGSLYYVMPYVKGETLRERLQREGQLSVDDALQIASDVAEALAYAHEHHVIHRDVKPENIMLVGEHAVVADFGIARAVREAAQGRITSAGFVVGTLAYMSPEQATGDPVDGRSDLYSLACVLYEMLSGAPPFAGGSPQAVFARRLTDVARPLRELRATVPVDVERAVARALACNPAERFQSVAAFATAIAPAQATMVTTLRPSRVARAVPWVAVAAIVAVLGSTLLAMRPAPVDPNLFVVLPFVHRQGAASRLLSGDNCQQLLYDEFQRWSGVRLVDDMRAHDAAGRHSGQPLSLQDVLGIARSLRAGRAAWGEVWQVGDAIHVRGSVYDSRRGTLVRQYSVSIRADLADAEQKFGELVDSLLVPLAVSAVAPPDDDDAMRGTRSVNALRLYFAGRDALTRWRLDSAQQLLRAAVDSDPDYAQAQLWLAQAGLWSGQQGSAGWRSTAERAALLSARLSAHDSILASGMLALAHAEYPLACAQYETLVARDSLDFAAWYGLGECRSRDRLVERDAASPSGWRFRSSQNAAIQSYLRALRIVPSFQTAFSGAAFSRLPALLYTESNLVLRGYAVSGDTTWFGAFPELLGDTLAFIPRPIADVYSGRPGTQPPSHAAAVARNRIVLRDVSARWVRAFPLDGVAHASLSRALEELGTIASARDSNGSALDQIRLARRYARDGGEAMRYGADEVRLLVKLGHFADARVLAESLLASRPNPTPREALSLTGLAELTGHIERAAVLGRQSAAAADMNAMTGDVVAPLPPTAAGLALYAFAASGAYSDSVRELEHQVDTLIGRWSPPQQRAVMSELLRDWAAVMAFPTLGRSNVHREHAGGDIQLEMQYTLARGDTAGVRQRFDSLARRRLFDVPGDVAIDVAFQEAWLRLMTNDTSAAVQRLDVSLGALATLGPELVSDAAQSAGLVRAMTLRAELAAQHGDHANAARWATPVVALWRDADPALQGVVAQMRGLAGQ